MALLLGLVLIAAACGGDDDSPEAADEGTDQGTDEGTESTEPERNPVEGGELVFGAEADVATLAPGEAAQPTDKVITLGIYDPLTTYIDGKVEPYLAETIESNE